MVTLFCLLLLAFKNHYMIPLVPVTFSVDFVLSLATPGFPVAAADEQSHPGTSFFTAEGLLPVVLHGETGSQFSLLCFGSFMA